MVPGLDAAGEERAAQSVFTRRAWGLAGRVRASGSASLATNNINSVGASHLATFLVKANKLEVLLYGWAQLRLRLRPTVIDQRDGWAGRPPSVVRRLYDNKLNDEGLKVLCDAFLKNGKNLKQFQ